MSLQTELDRIEGAKADIAAAIIEKGVTVPATTKLDGMAALISSIEAGSGGGELQYKTGTFTPAQEALSTNSITVTGLGIKPKIVYIRFDDDNANEMSNSHFTTTGKYYFISGIKTENIQKTVFHYHNATTTGRAIRTDREAQITINIDDDGFTITSTYANYFMLTRQYLYIAIG